MTAIEMAYYLVYRGEGGNAVWKHCTISGLSS